MGKDWLTLWEEYCESSPTPALFKRWTGIAAIAGALERKVWVRAFDRELYPNLYTVLIAPPGVGKSFLTSSVWHMWDSLRDHKLASMSLSKAAMIDELAAAQRHIVGMNGAQSFNSLLIVSNELGTLLPTYESDFMSTLTDLWDCHPFSERKRSMKIELDIPKPQLNMLVSTQPGYLANFLPETAWEQGFLSRCLLVYSGERRIVDPQLGDDESVAKANTKLWKELSTKLQAIGELEGRLTWEADAVELFTKWHMSGGAPAPEHPRLANYVIRRSAHALKLTMIASISEGPEKVIKLSHVQRALDWLVDMEHQIPDIFKAMSKGGDAKTIEECWYFVYKLHVKEQRPIAEFRVTRYLQEKTPSHNIDRILAIMVKGKMLQEKFVGTEKGFVPLKLD